MAYAGDLKSPVLYGTCGFDPHPGHFIQSYATWLARLGLWPNWVASAGSSLRIMYAQGDWHVRAKVGENDSVTIRQQGCSRINRVDCPAEIKR